MNSSIAHRLLFALSITTSLLGATDQTPASADVKPAAPTEVLVLPKIEITTQRIKSIDKDIKRLDKMIAREKKKVKSTDLDKTLNNAQVSRVAAIFGGNSSEYLSAIAATRVSLLETERDVFESMKRPATLQELAMMEAEVEQLREARRNLDTVQR